jgi:hypothetical protein
MGPELLQMVHAIQIVHVMMPKLRKGETIDSLCEGCCPQTSIPDYERMLQQDPSSLAALILAQQVPVEYLQKQNYSTIERRIAMFQTHAGECTTSLQKAEFDQEFFYYDVFRTRLSKWVLFYLFHANYGDSTVMQQRSRLTTGNIVSRRIFGAIGGLRHLGLMVGRIAEIEFIVDLDTNKRHCSRVAMKTLSEFASDFRISLHRDMIRKGTAKRPHLPLNETLEFLYQSIGHDLKYSLFASSDCDSFATFARYGVLMCNQVQIPYRKIHETIPRKTVARANRSIGTN